MKALKTTDGGVSPKTAYTAVGFVVGLVLTLGLSGLFGWVDMPLALAAILASLGGIGMHALCQLHDIAHAADHSS